MIAVAHARRGRIRSGTGADQRTEVVASLARDIHFDPARLFHEDGRPKQLHSICRLSASLSACRGAVSDGSVDSTCPCRPAPGRFSATREAGSGRPPRPTYRTRTFCSSTF